MATTASAGGNAQASLYIMASAPPDQTPFKTHLTNEEIERHAYFNDDILEIAEEIDEITRRDEARRVSLISQYGYPSEEGMGPNADPTYANPDRRSMSGQGQSRWAEFRRQQQAWEADIGELEDQILAELEEVRTEYRALAETLNNGRSEYVDHYLAAQQLTADTGVTRETVSRYGSGPGPLGAMASHDAQMSSYEKTHTDYKLIEQGFKHTTVRETLANLVWGAIGMIAMEIATAGVAKFVAIGAAAVRLTAVGRAAVAAGRAGQALIGRFMALAERTRTRVVNVVRRGRRSDPPAHPTDGPTVRGQPGQAARPRCATGACAL